MTGRASRGRRFTATTVEVEGRIERRIVESPDRAMKPWGEDADLVIVGHAARRVDAPDKVTGAARYTVDVSRPGMLHAAIVRAPVPSGEVEALELDAARAHPAFRAMLTRDEVPGIEAGDVPLFSRRVHYAGQPVAAICATGARAAREIAALVRVRVRPEPHELDAERAIARGARRIRADAGNVVDGRPREQSRGDVDAAIDSADVVIHREYRTPVALHSALEPHAAVAEWEGDHLTVWESTQGVFGVRDDLAKAFDLPLGSVRVLEDHMGGGFGAKTGASTNAYVAAALARITGAPVRCVNDRAAEQTDTGNRPATIQRVTLAATRAGKLVAIALDAIVPLGVGGWEGGPAGIYHEMYACANVRSRETFVRINASAMTAFRAPGHAEGAFGLECAMDALARELGVDPLELRRRNYATKDQRRNRAYSGKRLDECYDAGARRFGWTTRRAHDTRRMTNDESRVRRGVGMASQVWGAGGGPPAYAICRINGDGSVDVLSGTQDLGTGTRTVLAQIAAEELGARLADVRVVLADTGRAPYAGNSWGSMTLASVGPAVRIAACDAREGLLEAAAALMDVPAGGLTARNGVVRVRRGRRSMTFREIAEALGDVMIIGKGSRGPNPDRTAIATFGAQFAEVEVDAETGIVRVLRIVAVHDAGRIVNPRLAESQLHGGIIQGLGYALFEERVMDRRLGLPMNADLHDYRIPTMADIPEIDASFLGGADPKANEAGARGIAEPPIIPTAPAIANAVADALGVEVTEIPLTPWRVLAALQGARTP